MSDEEDAEATETSAPETSTSSSQEKVDGCTGPENCPAKLGGVKVRRGPNVICRKKCDTFLECITNFFTTNKYYWDILKSTIMFLIALKMARECMMLKIPMKEYKPFNRCIL